MVDNFGDAQIAQTLSRPGRLLLETPSPKMEGLFQSLL